MLTNPIHPNTIKTVTFLHGFQKRSSRDTSGKYYIVKIHSIYRNPNHAGVVSNTWIDLKLITLFTSTCQLIN